MNASDFAVNFLPTFLEFVLGGAFIVAARKWKIAESYLMVAIGAMGFLGCIALMAFAESSVNTMGIVLTLVGAVGLAIWAHIMYSTWQVAAVASVTTTDSKSPGSPDQGVSEPSKAMHVITIIAMFILLVGLVAIRWFNSGPSYDFRSLDETERKIMRTMWKYQKQTEQLGPGEERRFAMQIYPRTFEYQELLPRLDYLSKRNYISCSYIEVKKGFYCVLDNPGMVLMRSIGGMADTGITQVLQFDYVDISDR
jgi:hypothetical protein